MKNNTTTPTVIKKIKVYTALFSIAFFLVVLHNSGLHYGTTTIHYHQDEKLEMSPYPDDFLIIDTIQGGVYKSTPTLFSLDVNVRAVHNQINDSLILLASSMNQTYRVELQKVKLSTPASRVKKSGLLIAMASVGAIAMIIISIWTIVIIVKLINSIRRLEFFADNFSKLLERTGILLTLGYGVSFVGGFLFFNYIKTHVAIKGYEVVSNLGDCNEMLLLTGLGLMIISQIMLIATKIKEEQDLTI